LAHSLITGFYDTQCSRRISLVTCPGRPTPGCARLPSAGRSPPPPSWGRGRAGPCRGSRRRPPPCCASGRTTSAGHRPCPLESQIMATMLQPGRISPVRQVPAGIARPEYVGRKYPRTGETEVKDLGTIERMRAAGKIAARALAEVGAHVVPGVT